MQKREKIILILVFIAALYAVVDFTLTSQKKKAAKSAPQVDAKVVAELTSQLTALSSKDDLAIDRLAATIGEPWPGEAFVLTPPYFGKEEKVDPTKSAAQEDLRAKALQLVYSGFLAMGDDRIAIINGMDYRVGEEVDGFTISKISQETVEVNAQGGVFAVHATTEQAPPPAAETPAPDPN